MNSGTRRMTTGMMNGDEIDLIEPQGSKVHAVEIKVETHLSRTTRLYQVDIGKTGRQY